MTRQELLDTLTGQMEDGDVKETITQNIDVAYSVGYDEGYENAIGSAADIMWKHYRALKDKEPYEYMAYQRYQEIIKLGVQDEQETKED